MPGPIGPRLWTQAATALHPDRATNAVTVDAAGIQKSNMLHTLNTEPWAVEHGYREKVQAASSKHRGPSAKLQAPKKYYRKFVGPQSRKLQA